MTASHLIWYVDRGAGFTALVLLSVSMLLGLLLGMGVAGRWWPRYVTAEVHRFATLVALVFVAIHGTAVLLDPYTGFSFRDVTVPFASAYHPVAMAAGIVGAYLVAAVWLSVKVRRRIGYRMWRSLHRLAFAGFALGVLHTVLIGTDAGTAWGVAVTGVCVAAVAGLTAYRVLRSRPAAPRFSADSEVPQGMS